MLLKISAKSDFYIEPHSRFTVISEALNYDTFFAISSSQAEIFLAEATKATPDKVARQFRYTPTRSTLATPSSWTTLISAVFDYSALFRQHANIAIAPGCTKALGATHAQSFVLTVTQGERLHDSDSSR